MVMAKKTETKSEFYRYELYLLDSYLSELKEIKEELLSKCTVYSACKKKYLKLDIRQIESLQEKLQGWRR